MSAINDQAVRPRRCSGRRCAAQPSRRSSSSGARLVSTERGEREAQTAASTTGWTWRAARPSGGAAVVRRSAGSPTPRYLPPGPARAGAAPSAGRPRHRARRWPRRPPPADHSPSATTGRRADDLADEAEHSRAAARRGTQGQGERAGQPAGARAGARGPSRTTTRVRAATGPRSSTESGDHGERDEGGDEVGQQVAAREARTAERGDRGERQDDPAGLGDGRPGEQPHDVVLAQRHDVAERHAGDGEHRDGDERRAAERGDRLHDDEQRGQRRHLGHAGEEHRDRQRRAAYAVGGPGVERHQRELEGDAGRGPARRRGRAARAAAGSAAASSAGTGSSTGEPVAAYQQGGPEGEHGERDERGGEQRTAPATADRAPRSATSATTGRVASSRATSQVPRSRAAATAVAPAVAVSTRLTVTAALPSRRVALLRPGQQQRHERAEQGGQLQPGADGAVAA